MTRDKGQEAGYSESPPRYLFAVDEYQAYLDDLSGDDLVISTPMCVAGMIAAATHDIVTAIEAATHG